MKWLFRRLTIGLRTEIVLNILILVAASLLLIGFTVLKVTEKAILDEKVAAGQIIVTSLQKVIGAVESENWRHDPALARMVSGLSRLVEIQDIRIVDRSLKPLYTKAVGSFRGDDLAKAVQQGTQQMRIESSGYLWWSFYDRLLVTAPIVSKGTIEGAVQIDFSLAGVTQRLLVWRKLLLALVMADSLVLVIFGSLLLSRVLVNPLKRLVLVSQRIGQGDLDQRAEVEFKNEIGQLATAMNQMVESLAKKQKELVSTIDELQHTQRELILSEKLASIGRLAAGVAHEIGNPLASILGHTELLKKRLRDNPPLEDMVERVHSETERINRIIKDLLRFSRPSQIEVEQVDANKTVHDALELVRVQKGFKHVNVEFNCDEDLPAVRAARDQLQQVLVNLFMNAGDAMPEGGTVVVTTRGVDSGVQISIRDTGEGIDPEHLGLIFEPFYTTKSPDKGTGLGLSISRRIIEDLGGTLDAQSEPGRGATFTIRLPLETPA